MSDDNTPDLSLLARQQRQILMEMGSVRDDIAVLTAIAMRRGEGPNKTARLGNTDWTDQTNRIGAGGQTDSSGLYRTRDR